MASPFAPLRPPILVAGAYALATLAWMVLPDVLPGGRWLVVHLFTLGVLSNLVLALTDHFARTLLHARGQGPRPARLLAWNGGTLLLLTGLPSDEVAVFAAGASVLLVVVCWLYADLRRLRRASLSGRFAFVVRGYERACGAFLHGALLGLLMGTGALGGAWYGAGRLAHLHVNILGWGGLTLLATVVFFGPTVMRARIEPGADTAAARVLRVAALALTLSALALLLTGAGGAAAVAARLAAGAGLAVYAWAATVICLPVLRTLRRGRLSPPALHLAAACTWLLVAVWLDVAVVLGGLTGRLDAIGAILLVGVLGQAILGALSYLGPMAGGRRPGFDTGWVRTGAANVGVALIAAAAAAGAGAGTAGSLAARTGWTLVALAAVAALPLRRSTT